ncbi:MAG: TIGR00153 family protein [Elusimicrobia bacterium]|jgi:predicted phosphate transport protein (TIGR00153 family)|nr:TIGR00153 family protein [Elusimicrobiota bacterium]
MSKKIKLKGMFTNHNAEVKTSVEHLSETITLYFKNKYKESRNMAYEVHLAESRADTIRRAIIEKIKTSRIIPADQDDLISYAAKQDSIADRAESAGDFLITQRPDMPGFACDYLCDIMDITIQMTDPLSDAIECFFTDFSLMHRKIKTINTLEEDIDNIHMKLVKKLFDLKDIKLDRKMHINKFISHVVVISDEIENAADMLDPLAAKKKI